jgi:hypothetical protein
MPPRERRTVDCVLQRRGEPPRIVEFDEKQHFNGFRALTTARLPAHGGGGLRPPRVAARL